jgi:hypothetical protein
MKIFVGTKRPARPVDVVNAGIKAGTSTALFKVSRQDADRVRAAEAAGGQLAGLAVLLRVLRTRA